MMRFGVFVTPFGSPDRDYTSSQNPKPTIKSWQAWLAIGGTDVRLWFNVAGGQPEAPVSDVPGKWDTSLFRAFYKPAIAAGVQVNLNYNIVAPVPAHQDLTFHEAAASKLAEEFPEVDSWSLKNELGPEADAYEAEHPGSDYVRDVYVPLFLAFVRGVRRVIPNAWIGGIDSDSAEIQKRFTDLVDSLGGKDSNVLDGEFVHNYGDMGGGHYAKLRGTPDDPGFLDVRTSRPISISEIGHQELASARKRRDDVTAQLLAGGADPRFATLQGAIARLTATSEELRVLINLTRAIGRDHPEITRMVYNFPEYFFEPGRNALGLPCNSFYTDPIVSAEGRLFEAAFAEINGPVDPIKTTQPVGRRRAVKM